MTISYQNSSKFSVQLECTRFEVFVIVDERLISWVETVVRSVRENAEKFLKKKQKKPNFFLGLNFRLIYQNKFHFSFLIPLLFEMNKSGKNKFKLDILKLSLRNTLKT